MSPASGARGRAALLIAAGALAVSSVGPAPAVAASPTTVGAGRGPVAVASDRGAATGSTPAPQPAGPTAKLAWTATPTYPTPARSAPRAGARRVALVTPTAAWDGGAVGLLVLGARRDGTGRLWVRVQLPERPNGRSGWIDADYAKLSPTPWRIVVERGKRLAIALRAGRTVRRWRVVVGKPSTPTPRGLFAVYERVRQPRGSELGPWALQLTAHSNTLMNYGGGPGRVALHGRSGPLLADPLGSARSHGCVRMQNGVVSWVARWARPGTPVEIR